MQRLNLELQVSMAVSQNTLKSMSLGYSAHLTHFGLPGNSLELVSGTFKKCLSPIAAFTQSVGVKVLMHDDK